MMKTRYDKDMTDCTNAFYIENNIEMLWPIGPGTIYDEN